MNNYLLVYSGGGMPQGEAEQKMVMQAWEAWMKSIGSALVDGGNPFTPMAKTISSDGKVSDGSAVGMASGYSIIKADSMDVGVKMAKSCPVLQGGAKISVFETFNAM